jgi:hypothetical protein
MSSSSSWFMLCSETNDMPFIMEHIFSASVLIKIESYLLGMTLAVLILLDELIPIETAPIRGWPSVITIKQPFRKKVMIRKKLREVLWLTILVTRTSGSFSIGLPYANCNGLCHFEISLLACSRPKLCLVF